MSDQVDPVVESEEEDTEVVPAPPAYAFVAEDEQRLRCFILEHMGNPEIDGRILIENMDAVAEWITSGKVPRKAKEKHLKTVGEN